MGFLGVYTAIYDYEPQAQGELELREGDLLCILEKGAEDDWWKAKKKAERDDDDEPEGLVPNNYVEEVRLQPPRSSRGVPALGLGCPRHGPVEVVAAGSHAQGYTTRQRRDAVSD